MEKKVLDPDIFPRVPMEPVEEPATLQPAATPDLPDPVETSPDGPAEELDELNTKINALPAEKWKLYNILGGILVGVLAGVSLFVLSRIDEFSSVGFLGAVLLALILPRILERRVRRSIRTGKLVMLLSFGAVLLVQLVMGLVGRV